MSADVIATSAAHPHQFAPRRRKEIPHALRKAALVDKLMEAHATLTVVGSAWESVPGKQRVRLLQQAHAMESAVHQLWPERRKNAWRRKSGRIVTNLDYWRVVAVRTDLGPEAGREPEDA
jgi:hypothetical protein